MFVHLHTHTEYSLLDGMCRISQLVRRAKDLGMASLAITDHGAMHGVIDFYLAAKEVGINPIIGCELYVAAQDRHTRTNADKSPYHLVLLAKDKTGYLNLIQLVTRAHLEGFYYKPRVDRELLSRHHRGLVALSACPSGEIGRLILEGRAEDARKAALWHKEVFGDFYLELQSHAIPELEQLNRELVSMSRQLGIPLVATNDLHYIDKADAYAHDILLCIGTNASVYDEKRIKMPDDSFYLKSPQEMAALFPETPEALRNTLEVAEKCQLQLDFERLHLPEIDLPPGKTPDQYLADLCQERLRRRYPEVTPEIERRLAHELEVVRQTQFANYFLVVWDVISFAQKRGILLGVRGSAAASLVLYCLGITSIDPLETRLVFERFLNVERREMPDIDLDFQDDRRDEVISYVANKYGHDHVAQIITFGTLGARAALRDVGRALGMPYSEVDRVARLVPLALNITLERSLQESAELRNLYQADEVVKKLIDTAAKVEGIARHASTHAAGVVISRDPLTDHIPLQRPVRGEEAGIPMTQFAMENIAKVGLLKMDFLGLANLTLLQRVKELVAATRGIKVDLQNIPRDDKKTYELLSAGETVGVFQFEGAGMRRYLRELKPSTFSDIAAMVALYRPGPKQHIPTFIRAKHGQEPIKYPHEALSPILAETYGVIVYQDQVLFIVQTFAGYSLGRADIVRKAMGKKIPQVMKEERQHFIAGAIQKGFSEEIAQQVFDLIEPFAGYAFNKAHSVSYAMIAYQTAYFKSNFPEEFMTAFLAINMGQPERIATAVAQCHRLGIKVLPPDVNRSQETFVLEKDGEITSIRFGLGAIKNVGIAALKPILAAREQGGPFRSIEDFCRRADLRGLNKRMLESLIKAGAFDSLGNRMALLANIDRIVSLSQQEQRLKESRQSTMFDLWGDTVAVPLPSLDISGDKAPTSDTSEKLAWERELTGVYLSAHPFSFAAQKLASEVDTFCGQIDEEMEGQSVITAGKVVSVRQIATKDGRSFTAALLEDLDGSIEVTAWPELYERTKELWVEGNILVVRGKVRARGERVQVGCERVKLYEPDAEGGGEWIGTERKANNRNHKAPPKPPPPRQKCRLVITLEQTDDAEADLARLRELLAALQAFHGEDSVRLKISNSQGAVNLDFPEMTTDYCPELHQRLVALVGEASVVVEKLSG